MSVQGGGEGVRDSLVVEHSTLLSFPIAARRQRDERVRLCRGGSLTILVGFPGAVRTRIFTRCNGMSLLTSGSHAHPVSLVWRFDKFLLS